MHCSAKPSTLARCQVIFGSLTVIASSSWHTTLLRDHFTRSNAARLFPGKQMDMGNLGAKGQGFVSLLSAVIIAPRPVGLCSFLVTVWCPSSSPQCDWLNSYHQTCRNVIGKELQMQGRQEALEWLLRETEPISKQH